MTTAIVGSVTGVTSPRPAMAWPTTRSPTVRSSARYRLLIGSPLDPAGHTHAGRSRVLLAEPVGRDLHAVGERGVRRVAEVVARPRDVGERAPDLTGSLRLVLDGDAGVGHQL